MQRMPSQSQLIVNDFNAFNQKQLQIMKRSELIQVWTEAHTLNPYTTRSAQHHNDVIMIAMASQITSLTVVYLTVYSKRWSKKTSKLRVTGLCEGNSPVSGEFPAQMASNAENVSIWWRHHDK